MLERAGVDIRKRANAHTWGLVLRLFACFRGYNEACSYRGAYRVPLFNFSVCVYVCVTFVVFNDCESCTRPISTNAVSMEAGEYGVTRGTCFVARRL